MLVALLGTVDNFTYVEDYSCYRIAVWYAMYASILVLLRWRSDNDGGQENGNKRWIFIASRLCIIASNVLNPIKQSLHSAYFSTIQIQINFYTANFPPPLSRFS